MNKKLKELRDMSELAAIDEAIRKADSDWCNSLEAAWLGSPENPERLKKIEEEIREKDATTNP